MRRDKTAAKSRVYWKIAAYQQLKREWFMSHRNMRRYWNEQHAELYGQLGLMTRFLQWHNRRKDK